MVNKTATVQVRLAPGEKERWMQEAEQREMNLSAFIRKQVSRSLDREFMQIVINERYIDDIEARYAELKKNVAQVQELVEEFRDLFPSNRSGFFLE